MDKEMFEFQKNALLGKVSGEPLCAEYKKAWRACGADKEMLVRLALRQQALPYFITSCYRKLGLSKENILETYSEYINGKTFFNCDGVDGYSYQLYVDHNEPITLQADVLCLMWCNGVNVTIETSKCPIIYVGCGSRVHLSLNGYNSPRVYLFDDSMVKIDDADEDSKVVIYKYSDKAQVELGKYCLADVKVFNKTLKL